MSKKERKRERERDGIFIQSREACQIIFLYLHQTLARIGVILPTVRPKTPSLLTSLRRKHVQGTQLSVVRSMLLHVH